MLRRQVVSAKTAVLSCTLAFALLPGAHAQQFRVAEPVSTAGVPSLSAGSSSSPVFLGSYGRDGKFTSLPVPLAEEDDAYATNGGPYRRRSLNEVPSWINLHSRADTQIDDFAPPLRARKKAHGKSLAARMLEGIVAAAYGRDVILGSPTHLTTDSRGRIVLADPEAPAIQVLDSDRSFRIISGPQHRVQIPVGIAVDALDNIYVADAGSGQIAVYDPEGRFERYFGAYKDESMFEGLVAIAIDRGRQRIYALDGPTGELTTLDLAGKVVRRVGGPRRLGGIEFSHPSEIAVNGARVVVLDAYGARLTVLDSDCRRIRQIMVHSAVIPPNKLDMGLALDAEGNIYLSNDGWPGIRMYQEDGRLIGAFGAARFRNRELESPRGMWIDTAGRLFAADTRNSRIQVYQTGGQARAEAAAQTASSAARAAAPAASLRP